MVVPSVCSVFICLFTAARRGGPCNTAQKPRRSSSDALFHICPCGNKVPEELQRRTGISRISSAFSPSARRGALATLRKSHVGLRPTHFFIYAPAETKFPRGLYTKKAEPEVRLLLVLRRERDSNPRYSYPYTAFRVRPDRPLRHLSNMFGLFQSPYLSASAFPVHPNPTPSRTISRALCLTVCKDKNFYFMLEHVGGLFLILIPKMARILSFAR